MLHSPRFVDQSPTEVHATLLEEQTYLCSPRTMYRVLAAAHEVRERRAQAQHPRRAALLGLGITASHSRPRVSNDNPFSEVQFRTVKCRPEFPARFGALEHARGVSRDLFAWYNDAHHHSGLSYLTPADVHYGRAATVLAARHRTRLAAYAAHPERFVHGPPRPETMPTAVWINRPPTRETTAGVPSSRSMRSPRSRWKEPPR